MTPTSVLAVSLAAVAGVGWLAFLAIGRSRGAVKRLAWRATLLALAAALVAVGRSTGSFAQIGSGGRLTLLATAALLLVSYLYLVRFCASCGRMHRNFKPAECARCGSPLPEHGLTTRPRRTGPLFGRRK